MICRTWRWVFTNWRRQFGGPGAVFDEISEIPQNSGIIAIQKLALDLYHC